MGQWRTVFIQDIENSVKIPKPKNIEREEIINNYTLDPYTNRMRKCLKRIKNKYLS